MEEVSKRGREGLWEGQQGKSSLKLLSYVGVRSASLSQVLLGVYNGFLHTSFTDQLQQHQLLLYTQILILLILESAPAAPSAVIYRNIEFIDLRISTSSTSCCCIHKY
jgi:hypothetical protein